MVTVTQLRKKFPTFYIPLACSQMPTTGPCSAPHTDQLFVESKGHSQ